MKICIFFDGQNFYRSLQRFDESLRVDYARLATWITQAGGGPGAMFGVAGPADESVFLDEAPQRDGNVHAPSRIGFENTIGRGHRGVDPSGGVPR